MHKMSGVLLSMIMLINILSNAKYMDAKNSPEDYLRVHNHARAEVGVGPLIWNDSIAAFAQSYANTRFGDCSLTFSNQQTYGENLATSNFLLTGQGAVDLWVAQKPNYNHTSNSCVVGDCLSYTQVVWRHSHRLGCGRVHCANGWWFVSCNYYPPENIIGQTPY